MGKGRPGHDSDMAACILFLAGPGGLFLNAQVLYPDGGMFLTDTLRSIADRIQEISSSNPPQRKCKSLLDVTLGFNACCLIVAKSKANHVWNLVPT